MLFLVVTITALIMIPIFMLFSRVGCYVTHRERAQNVVEAAGLIAAKDLSRIVINDPNFGYVSLSNHPPSGKKARALDGEPMPVTGINTLIGTLRQNAVIAEQLHNSSMNSMVDKDLSHLQTTIKYLNIYMKDALSDKSAITYYDNDGSTVNPVSAAKTFITQNLPDNVKLESMKLSLGWLKGGSQTTVDVPKPRQYAQVHGVDVESGQYEAFTSVPVGKHSFSFAGLDKQAHLVSNRKFQDDDGEHVCTIVKIECTLVSDQEPDAPIQCVACSQPYSQEDKSPKGAMTVRFSGRPVEGLLSWREFLSPGFQDNKLTAYEVYNGDYPFDPAAKMRQARQQPQTGTSQQFAEHLYNWLRSGHVRPRVDSVLAMINEPFESGENMVYTYQFQDDGSIKRKGFDGKRFSRSVTADGQTAVMADTKVRSGDNAIIYFRDNVGKLNTARSKHGGQPLAGYPLEHLEAWMDHTQSTKNFGKRSSNSDGLAVDIEIGGTGNHRAKEDVISMHEKTRSRRI